MQQLQWRKDLIAVKEEDWPEGIGREEKNLFEFYPCAWILVD